MVKTRTQTAMDRHQIRQRDCWALLCVLGWVLVSCCGPVMAQHSGKVNLTASPTSLTTENGESLPFYLQSDIELDQPATVYLYSTDDSIAMTEDSVEIPANDTTTKVRVTVFTNISSDVGSVTVTMNSTSEQLGNISRVFVKVQVVHSFPLNVVIIVVGWIYFAAWTISFYPQVWLNFRRKSVVGLNFDFLAYNIIGFSAYGIFNVGMFWIDHVKDEYAANNPYGVNPVLLNDVLFTLHATAITAFTIFQCLIYERGGQKVSIVCKVLCSLAGLFSLVTLIITAASHERIITWLTYLYYFSYIKLGVSIIKYVPQAWMNFRRKSTVGWSIGNVLLDFTGGSFSLLQMFLLSYNNNDWASIFGDPTKFGLGLFSILFDILFMVQHYILYRHSRLLDGDEKDRGTEKENLMKGAGSKDSVNADMK